MSTPFVIERDEYEKKGAEVVLTREERCCTLFTPRSDF